MRMTDCSKLVKIHLHMPKTAGTTLKVLAKKNYQPEQIINLYEPFRNHEEVMNRLKRLELDETQWINCHLSFGIHEYLSRPAAYVTILRDPVERIISDYYFILNNPNHGMHKEVKKMSLFEFQSQQIHTNKQTKVIVGVPLEKTVDLEDIEQAKKNMEDYFCFVGITELFLESAFLMKQHLNWHKVKVIHRNVSKNRSNVSEISPTVIDQIKENNKIDIALYQYAKKEVENKLAALDPASKRKLQNLITRHKTQ
jgi:hypothetical protein